MRTARFDMQSVSSQSKIDTVTANPVDTLGSIAKANATTIESLKKLNPHLAVLQPGRALKFQKASMSRVITGRKPLSTASIATR